MRVVYVAECLVVAPLLMLLAAIATLFELVPKVWRENKSLFDLEDIH